jgi:hypothetical protein
MTTWRGVIWPRDSFLPDGREPREREGQGLKYPSVRLGMFWLANGAENWI